MSRRLFQHSPAAQADVRPTLLGVVTLLFLLLFFLLGTSSGNKLSVINLKLGTAEGLAPLPHSGVLQSLRVEFDAGLTVRATVQSTDIAASATTTEARVVPIARVGGDLDLPALARTLQALHQLDPAQRRATVVPTDTVTSAELLAVLDVVRGPAQAHFPELLVQDPE